MADAVHIPRHDYRGLEINYEQFRDLLVIAVLGHTDHLMDDRWSYRDSGSGMVNFQIAADALGLKYQGRWLDQLMHEFENAVTSYISSDEPPEAKVGNGYWAHLNSGIEWVGELLYPKYYLSPDLSSPDPGTIQDLILISIADRVSDLVDEVGNRLENQSRPYFYEIDKILEDDGHLFTRQEIKDAITALSEKSHVEISEQSGKLRAAITQEGHERAEGIVERYSDGLGSSRAGEVYFSVDASHISKLGLELVAKQETAVAELVKNGFDADATQVDLIFKTQDQSNSALEIFDNGSGMSRQDIVNGFMRLSTYSKVEHPTSPKYRRQRAGRKGIGRFAAQRLGEVLTITTATEHDEFAQTVRIDWREFSSNRELSRIPARISRTKKTFAHGTLLKIENLRDTWTDAQIARSHRHVSELIQPFPLSKSMVEPGQDPGFKATFAREEAWDLRIVSDDWTLFFQDALAEIKGSVDEEGRGFWSVVSKAYNLERSVQPIGPDNSDPSKPFSHLRNVSFQAYYYIDKELGGGAKPRVRDKLQESGGIRLYRNGFRVLPYGERYDDWLKLNASNLLRKILPPHSNRNFLGFVEIRDIDGKQFEETSSREGLVENDSFSELKEFVAASLKSAILPIADAREKRRTTTDTRRERRTPKGQADEILSRFQKLQEEAGDNPEYAQALATIVAEVRSSVIELGEEGQALLEELGMMRVLASLGLAIGEFTHEISLGFETLSAEAVGLTERIAAGRLEPDDGERLLKEIEKFRSYIAFFDATVRDNVDRITAPVEIRDAINNFIKFLEPRIRRSEISIDTKISGYGLYTRPMHMSEWASILINLFTNSLKAIRRRRVPGKIGINAGREEGKIYLHFSDNGDGIKEENRPRIFDAFFTTTSQRAVESKDSDGLTGMGLGLKIVRDIVEASGGEIYLIDSPEGYSTTFRVVVPAADEKDIPDDAV